MQTPMPPRRAAAAPPRAWRTPAREQPAPQLGDYLLALVLCVALIGMVAGLWYLSLA